MKHHKRLEAIVDQLNGWLPRNPTMSSYPKTSFRITQSVVPGVCFLATGIVLAVEGFYFIGASGFLFGQYMCIGPPSCMAAYHAALTDFWSGIVATTIGIALLLLGAFMYLRRQRRNELESSSPGTFERRSQRRLAVLSLAGVLLLSAFFLAPIVPVEIHSTHAISLEYLVCHQIESSVTNPVYIYGVYEAPVRSLFGVGNMVYYSCIVTNP